MIRERALKAAVVLVGLLFLAGLYPLLRLHLEPCEQMLGIVYATLGVFLLLTFRNPAANRSLIAFTASSPGSRSAHGAAGISECDSAR